MTLKVHTMSILANVLAMKNPYLTVIIGKPSRVIFSINNFHRKWFSISVCACVHCASPIRTRRQRSIQQSLATVHCYGPVFLLRLSAKQRQQRLSVGVAAGDQGFILVGIQGKLYAGVARSVMEYQVSEAYLVASRNFLHLCRFEVK